MEITQNQGCNFVKFSRGHVGPWIENFRGPQENLGAHNKLRGKIQKLSLICFI